MICTFIFSYHQKIPFDPPELELKATYGLAAPDDYTLPPMAPLWTTVTYSAFDLTKNLSDDASAKSVSIQWIVMHLSFFLFCFHIKNLWLYLLQPLSVLHLHLSLQLRQIFAFINVLEGPLAWLIFLGNY